MSSTTKVTVVMATYNRPQLLRRLLGQLAAQTVPMRELEVVVVDDGSKEPASQVVSPKDYPFTLKVLVQANAGAAAARHRGIENATSPLLIIIDDDMQVEPDFVAAHVAMHPPGTRRAVIGRLKPDPNVGQMPYFEKWYARGHEAAAEKARRGELQLTGNDVYTGNLSLRRDDYLAVGGFDFSMKRAEDTELGLRLEKSGVEILFSVDAATLHGSDHLSEEVWLRRAHLYGVYYMRIWRKHPELAHASAWRFLFSNNPLSRPFLAVAALAPGASKPVSKAMLKATRAFDKLGLSRLSDMGASVAYTMEYFRGVREESGSLGTVADDLWRTAKERKE